MKSCYKKLFIAAGAVCAVGGIAGMLSRNCTVPPQRKPHLQKPDPPTGSQSRYPAAIARIAGRKKPRNPTGRRMRRNKP